MTTNTPVQQFLETFANVAAFATGLVVVIGAIYAFNAIKHLVYRTRPFQNKGLRVIKLVGPFGENAWVDIHLSKGRVIHGLLSVGSVDPESVKDISGGLANMMVYRKGSGEFLLIRTEAIRAIEEIKTHPSPNPDNRTE